MTPRTLGLAAIAVVATLAGCGADHAPVAAAAVPAATVRLDTDRERASYVVGLDLAQSIASVRDDVDIDVVLAAVRATHRGERPLLDDAQAAEVRTAFTQRLREARDARSKTLAEQHRRDGDAFFARNAAAPGVVATASGLQYAVLRAGHGARPGDGDTVRVAYAAAHLDGREFESTYATDHPAEIALGQVMPGLREAITQMAVGGEYRVWIPAKLGYGDHGMPGEIDPGETLVYRVELLEVAAK